MKLSCSRATLAAGVQAVSAVIPARSPKPILQNLKLQILGGQAELIGTDYEISMRYQVGEVEAQGSGEVLLPTRRVSDILRELKEETVSLEIEEDKVWVRGGHSEFRLPVENPAEYPDVAKFEESKYFAVPARNLREMIRRTIFATDPESSRYALGGVLFEFQAEVLKLVATDSRRLALMQTGCSAVGGITPPPAPPVVPQKALQLLERTLGDSEEPVHIAVRHPNEVLFKTPQATLFTRLVEGRFPKYQDVVPKESTIEIALVAGAFHTAVRQAQIITNEESRGVDFRFENGMLTLTSEAADVGQSRVEMPIAYDGEPLITTFDPRFVADFLKVLNPETTVKLKLTTGDDAALFETDDGYQYVIMPLSRDR